MKTRLAAATLSLLLAAATASAQVIRVADLNTREIRALDRDKTIVFLQGGMLEEHGPYLPAFTDGYLSERLTAEVASGLVAAKPGWKALLFPPVSVGASGYNEIGGRFNFPGTYTVRPSTLRAIYMDLATELGEQGFKWVMVVHVHGSPLHIAAIDDAGDFFHDTYGGRMINLWGLVPVISGWGNAMSVMTAAEKAADGMSLHAGADEHSLMLHLKPELVAKDYKSAAAVTGATMAASVAAANSEGWPGYIGAPGIASAELGRQIWNGFSAAALKSAVDIVNGADPASIERYMTFMLRNPIHQDWIKRATARDASYAERQRAWMEKRKR
ncbi:MAG TPA: creatininase family protein [Vicinamibacterales bacterium]|nr:creatininase family protein [Vicinamibacterales bacterium]